MFHRYVGLPEGNPAALAKLLGSTASKEQIRGACRPLCHGNDLWEITMFYGKIMGKQI